MTKMQWLYLGITVWITCQLGCSLLMEDKDKLGEPLSTDSNQENQTDSADMTTDSGVINSDSEGTDSTNDLCTENQSLTCHDNNVWCADDLGTPVLQVDECTGGQICVEGDPDAQCECLSHDTSSCLEGDVWWFDSCGNSEEVFQFCDGINQACETDSCECEHGWSGEHCEIAQSCIGKGDFTRCDLDTTNSWIGDLKYDVCINQSCVSPGTCNTSACNGVGIHFSLSESSAYTEETPGEDIDEIVIVDSGALLNWTKCPAKFSGESCETVPSGFEGLTWKDAFLYCDGLEYGGYSDWYLPNEYELQTLVDYQKNVAPVIDDTVFPGTPSLDFWTSSSYDLNSDYGTRVFFISGTILGDFSGGLEGKIGLKDEAHHVRCVRRDPEQMLESRFSRYYVPDYPDEYIVEDNVGERMWQGCAAGFRSNLCDTVVAGQSSTLSWSDAVTYCSSLNYGGYDSWRMPTNNELFSLIDISVAGDAKIDPDGFPGTPAGNFWGADYSLTEGYSYYANFAIGFLGSFVQEDLRYVRCVRNL